jgi:hypothetical protein
MHGHGYAPPQPQRPSTALLVVLRIIFVAVSLFSIGLLSWVSMLRVAIVTRRRRDWAGFWAVIALVIASMGFLVSDPTDEISTWRGNVGILGLLGTGALAVAYYLYADILHYRRPQPPHPPQPPYAATSYPSRQPPAYGYPPQPGAPAASTSPYPGPVPGPVPGPAHPHPHPPRIDQVRAELDELSDYLRNERGGEGR